MTSPVRRRLLAGALLSLTGVLPFSRAFGSAPRNFAQLPTVSSDDLRARIWLGEHYLRLHSDECSTKRIACLLSVNEFVSVRSLIDRTDLRQLIRQQHNEDYRNGNVVIIDGWVLTRTEARVFALSAIESAR